MNPPEALLLRIVGERPGNGKQRNQKSLQKSRRLHNPAAAGSHSRNKERPLAARFSVSSRDIFRAVWSGMAEVFARLRGPSIIGFSIYLVFEAGEAAIGPDNSLLRDILDGIRDVLLVPFDIAIYRLLILGEVTSRYSFALNTRLQRIAGWTIVLWSFNNIPLQVLSLVTSSDLIKAIAIFAAMAAGTAVAVRIAIFFPAIASDARGATIGSALADTRGQVWFILKAFLIVFLPQLMVTIALAGLASLGVVGDVSDPSMWSALPQVMLIGTIGFLTQAANAVIASLLFDWIGTG
jgi:hypothetical protein